MLGHHIFIALRYFFSGMLHYYSVTIPVSGEVAEEQRGHGQRLQRVASSVVVQRVVGGNALPHDTEGGQGEEARPQAGVVHWRGGKNL